MGMNDIYVERILKILLIITVSVLAIVVSGCNEPAKDKTPTMPKQTVVPTENFTSQLPNPASKYCIEQGYNITIRTNPDGSQTGYCIFPDGSECEEWAYFRGECKHE